MTLTIPLPDTGDADAPVRVRDGATLPPDVQAMARAQIPEAAHRLRVTGTGATDAAEDAALDAEIAALLADITDPNRHIPLRPAAELYPEWLSAGFVGARPARAGEPTAQEAVRPLRENAFTRGKENQT